MRAQAVSYSGLGLFAPCGFPHSWFPEPICGKKPGPKGCMPPPKPSLVSPSRPLVGDWGEGKGSDWGEVGVGSGMCLMCRRGVSDVNDVNDGRGSG